MTFSARKPLLFVLLALFALAFPAYAANVTISGNVNFSSLDGSSLDDDHVANGTFTVNGDLTVLGTINCNDDAGPSSTSACPMQFVVGGNFSMLAGSAIYAENRRGNGNGGDISFTIGGNASLASSAFIIPGAVISSAGDNHGGNITFSVGGGTTFNDGSVVSAASSKGPAGNIALTSGGAISLRGSVLSGPSRSTPLLALLSPIYTGEVMSGGSDPQAGGNISIRSNSHTSPAVSVVSNALIVSQGESGGSGTVSIDGCGISITGFVGSLAKGGTTSKVSIRSGADLSLDGRDVGRLLGGSGRLGMIRADSTHDNAATYVVDLLARTAITVQGPDSFLSQLYAVNSNPDGTHDSGGTINVVSLGGTVTASGNAFHAGDTAASDSGGTINVSASGNVVLDGANINAEGDDHGSGGHINVRSYSGSLSWQAGTGDVRPVGSGTHQPQGTITLTYCTTHTTSGTVFLTNGQPLPPFPVTAQSCSPAAPSLPAGEAALTVCVDAPTANNDAYSTPRNTTLNVAAPGVLANDTTNTATISSYQHTSAQGGAVTLNANGSFSYVPAVGFSGTDTFTYTLTNLAGSSTATVTITVVAPPVANNDAYSTALNTPLSVSSPGVLGNDSVNGATISAHTNPAHGSVSLASNGSFVYNPTTGYTGPDSFTYTLTNIAGSSTATVSLTVVAPPTAANDAYNVVQNTALTVPAPGVLGNDTLNGASISAHTNPAHGTLTLNADGSFTYTPATGYAGADSFTYTITNIAGSSTATVSLTVIAPPVAVNDSYAAALNTPRVVAAPGVLGNDTLNGATISGSTSTAHGTVVLNADGSFTYTPATGYTGPDSFTYTLTNFAGSSTATVSLTVFAPPVANGDAYDVAQNTPRVVAAPGVLGNDSVNGATITGNTSPAHGSVTLNADGSFTYTPATGYAGSDSFTYTISNFAGSSTATVALTVFAPPVAVADAYSAALNTPRTVAAPGVLANDSVNGAVISGNTNPANGTVTLNADGSFTYTPNSGFTGADTFTYTLTNFAGSSTATVTITVFAAPVANNDAYSAAQNTALTVPAPGVLGNDSVNGATISGFTQPANGTVVVNADGSFTYTPATGYTGADSFTYTLTNFAGSSTATVAITVFAAPTAVDDSYSVVMNAPLTIAAPGVLGNDTVNGATITANTSPTHGTLTLNADGSFTYTPASGYTGSDSFTYTITNAAGSSTATVTLTVFAPPVAVDDSAQTPSNTPLTVAAPGVLANDTVNGATIASNTNPSHGTVTLNADGSYTYTPASGFAGNDSFTYTLTNVAGSSTATVTIHVFGTPVANNDSYNVSRGGTINQPAPGVLGNDTDPGSFPLTAVLVSGPAHASSFTLHADGSFTYVQDGTNTLTDTFTYKANDGFGDSNVATVTINLINQPPVAGNDSYVAVGNTQLRVGTASTGVPSLALTGSVLDNDTDPDTAHNLLTVSSFDSTSAGGGSVAMNPDGTFRYVPAVGFTGVDSFHYTVTDGTASSTGTVSITVSGRVWYVRNNAVSGGDGRSPSPFNTLSSAQSASAAGDVIYVHAGDGTTTNQNSGIVLKTNQSLIGERVPLVVNTFTLNPAGASPHVGGSPAVTLASGNTVAGFVLNPSTSGITGSAVTGGNIATVTISGGTSDGISLTTASGTFTMSDTSIATLGSGRGLVVNGGSPTINASNLDITTVTGNGINANAGTLNITAGADGSTVATTTGTAINITNTALGVTLRSVNSANDANGIVLNATTGSFNVTGDGATAGSGGTIQNMTTRGASIIGATNVALRYMNFTSASTTNGTAAASCTDLTAGNNLLCNAAVYLQNASNVTLDHVLVDTAAQIGVNGNGVNGLTINDSEVRNAGNEAGESGLLFQALTGTVTLTNDNFHDNAARQMYVDNASGTLTMAISNSTFANSTAPNGQQGLLVEARTTANATVSVSGSTFTSNRGNAVQIDGDNNAVLNASVSGSTFTSNNAAILMEVSAASALTYSIQNNVTTNNNASAMNVSKLSGSATASGTISGNTIGQTGVAGSGASCGGGCDGIDLNSFGTSGFLAATVTNNTIQQVDLSGINAISGSGPAALNLNVTNNTVREPAGSFVWHAIVIESGAGSPTDTASACAGITGNIISGAWDPFGTTDSIGVYQNGPSDPFNLPGFAGPFNSDTAIQSFISGNNGGASAFAFVSSAFTGGPACNTP